MAENPFKPMSIEEQKTAGRLYKKTLRLWVKKFGSRKDVVKNSDGSYDVWGDLEGVPEVGNGKLCVRLNLVIGNFSHHGMLKSLDGFPKKIGGNLKFWNHQKEFTAKDIQAHGYVRGKLDVQYHPGL